MSEDSELCCQDARGVLGGSLGEAGDCGGVEWHGVEVSAMGVGVFAVGRGLLEREVEENVPQAAGSKEAFAGCSSASEAQRVAWRSAGGFQDYFRAIFADKGAGGICVGIGGEKSSELGGGGVD